MEVIRSLTRRQDATEMLAIGLFVAAGLLAVVRRAGHTLMVGVALVLIVLGALPRQVALAFLVGALAMLLIVPRRSRWEGFEDASGAAVGDASGESVEAEVDDVSGAAQSQPPAVAGFQSGPSPIADPAKKPMLPDNADRREMLELGKPYKLPSESDDGPYHLDAGTTFLNAYKALKPEQIAAMTRDTQELLATQKSLVSMLDSFGPLLKDMNKITGFFGGGGSTPRDGQMK
jgi:hypothetical protein